MTTACWNTRQELLRLGQRQPQIRDIAKVAGPADLLAPQLLAQHRRFRGIHPVKLENMLRRIHSNSANLAHGRSPLSEISNDLILAHRCRRGPSTPTIFSGTIQKVGIDRVAVPAYVYRAVLIPSLHGAGVFVFRNDGPPAWELVPLGEFTERSGITIFHNAGEFSVEPLRKLNLLPGNVAPRT